MFFLAFSFSKYVCMCDYSMWVCFLMWWFCWFGHHCGIKVENYNVLFFFVYCELWTNKQVNYYYYIFYTDVCIVILDMIVLWAGCQRVLCMFVVSYVPTITVMSSCTQPTKCWLQTDISVNFKQYEGFYSWIHATFHKAIKYSNIH